MITVKFFNNKYFYTTVTLFLILLIFEDTTLYRLYEMKKELNIKDALILMNIAIKFRPNAKFMKLKSREWKEL